MTKTYTLTVFNTCTSQYEDIEVTKEVYNEFRRREWRIEKNDDIRIRSTENLDGRWSASTQIKVLPERASKSAMTSTG